MAAYPSNPRSAAVLRLSDLLEAELPESVAISPEQSLPRVPLAALEPPPGLAAPLAGGPQGLARSNSAGRRLSASPLPTLLGTQPQPQPRTPSKQNMAPDGSFDALLGGSFDALLGDIKQAADKGSTREKARKQAARELFERRFFWDSSERRISSLVDALGIDSCAGKIRMQQSFRQPATAPSDASPLKALVAFQPPLATQPPLAIQPSAPVASLKLDDFPEDAAVALPFPDSYLCPVLPSSCQLPVYAFPSDVAVALQSPDSPSGALAQVAFQLAVRDIAIVQLASSAQCRPPVASLQPIAAAPSTPVASRQPAFSSPPIASLQANALADEKLSVLRQKAEKLGVDRGQLDDALDADSPKAAVIKLIAGRLEAVEDATLDVACSVAAAAVHDDFVDDDGLPRGARERAIAAAKQCAKALPKRDSEENATVKTEASSDQADTIEEVVLPDGTLVTVVDFLVNSLNGRRGKVVGYESATKRYQVRLFVEDAPAGSTDVEAAVLKMLRQHLEVLKKSGVRVKNKAMAKPLFNDRDMNAGLLGALCLDASKKKRPQHLLLRVARKAQSADVEELGLGPTISHTRSE